MTEARPARPGFDGVDYDEAMRRARGLVPALRERAAAAEAGREMPKETIEDLHRTGLFRFHQPRRWGGMELDFVALFDVPAEIGLAAPRPPGTSPISVCTTGCSRSTTSA